MAKKETSRWLTRREAYAVFVEHRGALAPPFNTFCTWTGENTRNRGHFPKGIPEPIRVPGTRGLIFDREALEKWLVETSPEAVTARQVTLRATLAGGGGGPRPDPARRS